MSNSSSSNVIRTLFFSIQSLFRITFLEIGLTYMIIHCWPSSVLSWLFIHSLRIIFSFVIVLVFISYLIKMTFNLFSRVHFLDIIVILISESISLSLVVILSSSSCIIIEKIIRFSSFNFSSFLRLFRFSTYRRL